jgi:hypothetical protein
MSWVRDHWKGIAGSGALLLSLWQAFRTLLSWGGEVDFVISHIQSPGWVGALLGLVLAPPPFLTIALVVLGLLLIFLQVRTRSVDAVSRVAPADVVGRVTKRGRANAKVSRADESQTALADNDAAEKWLNSLKGRLDGLPVNARVVRGRQGKMPYERGVDTYMPLWTDESARLTIGIRNDAPRPDTSDAYFYVVTTTGVIGTGEIQRHKGRNADEALKEYAARLKTSTIWHSEYPRRAKSGASDEEQ